MKIGLRKISPSKSLKAMTTGKGKRALKSLFVPGYNVKGTGFLKNPRRSVYNKVYKKTTFSLKDLFKF